MQTFVHIGVPAFLAAIFLVFPRGRKLLATDGTNLCPLLGYATARKVWVIHIFFDCLSASFAQITAITPAQPSFLTQITNNFHVGKLFI